MRNSAPASQEGLTSALSDYLSQQAGQPVDVVGLTRMSDGWESDVYAFDAPAWREGERILRIYFGTDAGPKALHEYRSLDLLARAGYPVPQVDLVEPSTQALGRSFLIMERVNGAPLGNLWKDPDPAVSERAMTQFCQLFASLHTLNWAHLPGAQHVPLQTIAQQLAYWNGFVAGLPSDTPAIGMSWLQAASSHVTPKPVGLAHWDFHHENILVGENDRAWVIDWTQFMATDVRFDLAWTLTLLASERSLETSELVRAGYAAVRGWDMDEVQPELNFFEAAACLKRLISVLISLRQGADAVGMRPGAEQIISSRLSRFAVVYKRWLTLTATPLPDFEELLAAHL